MSRGRYLAKKGLVAGIDAQIYGRESQHKVCYWSRTPSRLVSV